MMSDDGSVAEIVDWLFALDKKLEELEGEINKLKKSINSVSAKSIKGEEK